jgi:hypothetical protein
VAKSRSLERVPQESIQVTVIELETEVQKSFPEITFRIDTWLCEILKSPLYPNGERTFSFMWTNSSLWKMSHIEYLQPLSESVHMPCT